MKMQNVKSVYALQTVQIYGIEQIHILVYVEEAFGKLAYKKAPAVKKVAV